MNFSNPTANTVVNLRSSGKKYDVQDPAKDGGCGLTNLMTVVRLLLNVEQVWRLVKEKLSNIPPLTAGVESQFIPFAQHLLDQVVPRALPALNLTPFSRRKPA